MRTTRLSIVIPVHNEAATLPELIERCSAVASKTCGDRWELIVVDDASTDNTAQVLEALAAEAIHIRHLHLPRNTGQFHAVKRGLQTVNGEWICVIDGDLQDPPELIPDLVDALADAHDEIAAVFAVKRRREEPLVFRLAQTAFHATQTTFSRTRLPCGASSYCLLRRWIADVVSDVGWSTGNVAAVVAGVGANSIAVTYVKAARPVGRSRIGFAGHLREAVASLAMTGALGRMGRFFGSALAVLAVLAAILSWWPVAATSGLCATTAIVTGAYGDRRRRALLDALKRATASRNPGSTDV